MFSHETPDLSDQSSAEGGIANFMSYPAAASELLKWGEEKSVKF